MFFYYVPKCSAITRETIISLGLASVIEDVRSAKVLANGPDGGSGLILCDKSYGVVPQMHAAVQTWRAAPKRGADRPPYWIGYQNDAKPTVSTLSRVRQLEGPSIELRDLGKWQVPSFFSWRADTEQNRIVYSTGLPHILDIDDAGNLVPSKIAPAYESIWGDVWRAHESIVGQAASTGKAVMTSVEAYGLACRILGVNYRVSAIEIAMLGLFDDVLPIEVVKIAIGNESFWEAAVSLSVNTPKSVGEAELEPV